MANKITAAKKNEGKTRIKNQLNIDGSIYGGIIQVGDIYEGSDPKIISYAVLEVSQDHVEEWLMKIAAMMNVQLSQAGQQIPFVPFEGFDIQRLKEEKLFLSAPSGAGKSRTIFEIIKGRISRYNKIFILNPRNLFEEKLYNGKLQEVINRATDDNAIVWDNFPDNLVRKRFDHARDALEIVSSARINDIFIGLKPTYLELYRNISANIPEIESQTIFYDKEKIKTIIKNYGTNIVMQSCFSERGSKSMLHYSS